MFTHLLLFKMHTNLICLLCLLDAREIMVTVGEFNVYFCRNVHFYECSQGDVAGKILLFQYYWDKRPRKGFS